MSPTGSPPPAQAEKEATTGMPATRPAVGAAEDRPLDQAEDKRGGKSDDGNDGDDALAAAEEDQDRDGADRIASAGDGGSQHDGPPSREAAPGADAARSGDAIPNHDGDGDGVKLDGKLADGVAADTDQDGIAVNGNIPTDRSSTPTDDRMIATIPADQNDIAADENIIPARSGTPTDNNNVPSGSSGNGDPIGDNSAPASNMVPSPLDTHSIPTESSARAPKNDASSDNSSITADGDVLADDSIGASQTRIPGDHSIPTDSSIAGVSTTPADVLANGSTPGDSSSAAAVVDTIPAVATASADVPDDDSMMVNDDGGMPGENGSISVDDTSVPTEHAHTKHAHTSHATEIPVSLRTKNKSADAAAAAAVREPEVAAAAGDTGMAAAARGGSVSPVKDSDAAAVSDVGVTAVRDTDAKAVRDADATAAKDTRAAVAVDADPAAGEDTDMTPANDRPEATVKDVDPTSVGVKETDVAPVGEKDTDITAGGDADAAAVPEDVETMAVETGRRPAARDGDISEEESSRPKEAADRSDVDGPKKDVGGDGAAKDDDDGKANDEYYDPDAELSEMDENEAADYDPATAEIHTRRTRPVYIDADAAQELHASRRKRKRANGSAAAGARPRRRRQRLALSVSDSNSDDDGEYSNSHGGGDADADGARAGVGEARKAARATSSLEDGGTATTADLATESRRLARKRRLDKTTAASKKRGPAAAAAAAAAKAEADYSQLSPEERRRREISATIDAALAQARRPTRRRKRDDEMDLLEDQVDEELSELKVRMEEACQADNLALAAGRPAVQKLKLLPEVTMILSRTNAQDAILDPEINFLQHVRFFLEPLENGILPGFAIQRDLFASLGRLPIGKEALVSSRLGGLVLFYTRSRQPTVMVKRMAQRLVEEWSRPILNKTNDYSLRNIKTRYFDPGSLERAQNLPGSRGKILNREPVKIHTNEVEHQLANPRNSGRTHLHMVPDTYTIAPKTTFNENTPRVQNFRPIGANAIEAFKRMTQRSKKRK